MHCYEVKCKFARRIAGTNALSRTARQEMVDEHGVKKKDVQITEIDVPMAKPKLIEYINNILTELDTPDEGGSGSGEDNE